MRSVFAKIQFQLRIRRPVTKFFKRLYTRTDQTIAPPTADIERATEFVPARVQTGNVTFACVRLKNRRSISSCES